MDVSDGAVAEQRSAGGVGARGPAEPVVRGAGPARRSGQPTVSGEMGGLLASLAPRVAAMRIAAMRITVPRVVAMRIAAMRITGPPVAAMRIAATPITVPPVAAMRIAAMLSATMLSATMLSTTMLSTTMLRTTALISTLITPLIGCGREPEPAPPPMPAPPASTPATRAAAPPRRPEPRPAPVAAPSGATVGEIAPAVPRPAPRLFDGKTTAAALPDVSCEEFAPEPGYTLARKVEVLTAPAAPGEPARTLELCQFNRWLRRTDDELGLRTGRKHHFVAAFPGSTVASWTSPEIERRDLGLSEAETTGLAAGWAALIPTGIPRWPAIAVTSARLYAGPLGERVRYLRRARVLLRKAGRWTWAPLHERAFTTLDVAWLEARCEDAERAERPGCRHAAELIAADARAAVARGRLRRRRLAGRADPAGRGRHRKGRVRLLEYKGDPDPAAAWLRDGRRALKTGDTTLALRTALRVQAICGEPVRAADELIRAALDKAGIKRPTIRPRSKLGELCEPLPDKAPPKERKR